MEALPQSHASAAAAAVVAVAKERAEAKAAATVRRASLRLDAVQDARRGVEHELRLRAEGGGHEGGRGSSKDADGPGPYVAEAAATRKWPKLSPRSAVEKEQAIQELAVLPEGMTFYAELSADDTRRILNGLSD